jgi:hypothetical protein
MFQLKMKQHTARQQRMDQTAKAVITQFDRGNAAVSLMQRVAA